MKKRNTESHSSKTTFTPQQKQFIIGLEQLELAKILPDLYSKEETDKIVMRLWKSVCPFALKITCPMIRPYVSNPEKDEDHLQNLFLAFLEQLPDYDPYRSSPTTFFAPYFRAKTRKYIRSFTNLSEHYIKNMGKLMSAANYFRMKNITPTLKMLSEKANLSEKVIRSLCQISTYRKTSVDLAESRPSQELTAEQMWIRKETISVLINAVKNNLSAYEQKIFFCHLNLEGNKKRTYAETAKIQNISVYYVKKIYSSCLKKLRDCEEIRLLDV